MSNKINYRDNHTFIFTLVFGGGSIACIEIVVSAVVVALLLFVSPCREVKLA